MFRRQNAAKQREELQYRMKNIAFISQVQGTQALYLRILYQSIGIKYASITLVCPVPVK